MYKISSIKLFRILFFIALIPVLVRCSSSKQPETCFELSVSTAKVNEYINLTTYCTKNPWATHIEWGDGKTDDLPESNLGQAIIHSYNAAGAFTITVTITSRNGKKTDTTSQAVTITP